jgi:hypothetical protein
MAQTSLFSGVRYRIAPGISQRDSEQYDNVLSANGAQEADRLEDATHIVANTDRFEGCQAVTSGGAIVTVGTNVCMLLCN